MNTNALAPGEPKTNVGVRDALSWMASVALCCIFVISGFSKLNAPFAFLIGLYDWQLIGPPYARYVAAGLPWIELFIAFGIVIPITRNAAAVLASVLCGVFLAAQASVIYRGLTVECACFGTGGARVGLVTMIRTAACLGAAVTCLLAHRERTKDRLSRQA